MGDRFIPNRSTTDMEYAQHAMSKCSINGQNSSDSMDKDNKNNGNSILNLTEQLRLQKMAEVLTGKSLDDTSRILSFSNKAPAADEAHVNNNKALYSTGAKTKVANAANTRQVTNKPEKVRLEVDFII